MSQPRAARTIYDDPTERELARWPGVEFHRDVRGKHYALVLTFRGQSRFVVYPSSPSDSGRGALNHLTNVRAELRALGAQRIAPTKAERKRRARQPDRLVIVMRDHPDPDEGPLRDPWAALVGLNTADTPAVVKPVAPAPPPVAPGLWARVRAWLKSWRWPRKPS